MLLSVLITLITIFPPTNVRAFDTPNDAGGSITITWELSKDDSLLLYYEVMRSTELSGKYEFISRALPGSNVFEDKDVETGKQYYYFVKAVTEEEQANSEVSGPAIATAQWFHHGRWSTLILGIIFCSAVVWFIRRARKDTSLFVRKIPGLEAVDEAIGRSTELGKPILYILGLGTLSDATGGVATLAALSILRRVARKAAEYDTPIIVPCFDPVVMAIAQDTVKQAHMEVGRPDTFKEDSVYFLTADQFGYAAGCDGIMLRERPGAIFLQGYFYAESLILAETGRSVGAIQIAGTSATLQLPFFVAACDYTLIGEELFAAAAYLGREPLMLGSIKGEDLSKLVIGILIVVGVVLSSLAILRPGLSNWASSFINWFTP